MKKAILAIVILIGTSFSLRAGMIVTDSLRSEILGGAVIKYNVYLPDGFRTSGKQYPSVYLLHGLSDDYTAWKDKGNMQIVTDELIGSGEACEMVIFMPGAGTEDVHRTWCGYFNMPLWSYEDFFFGEFVPEVEAKYRCIPDKGHRAIMGLSMGGGGSTVYCQRHPDMFSSCFAMSAWLDEKSFVEGKGEANDCLYYTRKSVREHSALDFLDTADAASIETLRSVAWFFDCGDDDSLLELSLQMHLKMRKAGIKDELRVRNGVHNWEYWHTALRESLPFASRNFDR